MDYFKTDAAEAEVLTGLTDRVEAAKMLHDWAPRKWSSPTTPRCWLMTARRSTPAHQGRNLSGRTGRGDTTLPDISPSVSGQRGGSAELLHRLVSLKMETPGPLRAPGGRSGLHEGILLIDRIQPARRNVPDGLAFFYLWLAVRFTGQRVHGNIHVDLKGRFHGKW